MNDAVIVPAAPGYLKHLTFYPEDGVFRVATSPIVAWHIAGDRCWPVTLPHSESAAVWDSAIELPDGRCIDDGSHLHDNRAAWLRACRASWEEDDEEESRLPGVP
jgi:hypothetical protein